MQTPLQGQWQWPQAFYDKRPALLNTALYLTGESFAGQVRAPGQHGTHQALFAIRLHN